MQRDGKKPLMGKRYNFGNLEKMIMEYHMKSMSEEEKEKGKNVFFSGKSVSSLRGSSSVLDAILYVTVSILLTVVLFWTITPKCPRPF